MMNVCSTQRFVRSGAAQRFLKNSIKMLFSQFMGWEGRAITSFRKTKYCVQKTSCKRKPSVTMAFPSNNCRNLSPMGIDKQIKKTCANTGTEVINRHYYWKGGRGVTTLKGTVV
jgi:hypothetical protein